MKSPCVLICSIDQATGWCHGCGRTIDEIGAWTLYTDEKRDALMETLPTRVAQLEKHPKRETKRRALQRQRTRPNPVLK